MFISSFIGMMRSFLVYPTYMVFPNVIPTVQMFDVLHRGQENILQKKRVKFFWALFIGICGFSFHFIRHPASVTSPGSAQSYGNGSQNTSPQR